MPPLSRELVEAQAPDASGLSAGRSLASPAKWETSGSSDRLLWGECKGSGKKPYVVQVDLSDLVAKCSCPSRKFPCKHSLALMLLAVDGRTGSGPEPDWAVEWLEKRHARAEAKEAKVSGTLAPEQVERSAAEQARRAQKRSQKVDQGVVELLRWLDDLVSDGLLAAQSRPGSWWDTIARRLVDAQAPRLAELVELLGQTVRAGRPGWERPALDVVGELVLCCRGWEARERLSGTPLEVSVRAALGLPLAEDVRLEGVWTVLTSTVHERGRLSLRHTWVESDARLHLLRSYAYQGSLTPEPPPGTSAPAALTLGHPDATHAKATWQLDSVAPATLPEGMSLTENAARYAAALGEDPWLSTYPFSVRARIVRAETWRVEDESGLAAPLGLPDDVAWAFHASSLDRVVDLHGEWDGAAFSPSLAVPLEVTV